MKVDPTKAIVTLAMIAASTVLVALGKVDGGAGLGLIGTVGGYVLGNGKSVASGDRPGTLLTRTDRRDRATDAVDLDAGSA